MLRWALPLVEIVLLVPKWRKPVQKRINQTVKCDAQSSSRSKNACTCVYVQAVLYYCYEAPSLSASVAKSIHTHQSSKP